VTEPIRERRGRLVRETVVTWAKRTRHPRTEWKVPYDSLDEAQQECCMLIGDAVAEATADAERRRAEVAETRLAELEAALSWQTSCTSCAAVLDSSYREHCARESAEEKLAQVREAVSGDGPSAAVVREKVIRILDGAS
jgi:hypothetical protein